MIPLQYIPCTDDDNRKKKNLARITSFFFAKNVNIQFNENVRFTKSLKEPPWQKKKRKKKRKNTVKTIRPNRSYLIQRDIRELKCFLLLLAVIIINPDISIM